MKTIYNTQDDIEVDGLNMNFQDECINLSVATEQPIIAIARSVFHDTYRGTRYGYKVGGTLLKDIMYIGTEDYNHVYYDGFNVRKTSTHHDGHHDILFREFKPNVNREKFINYVLNLKPNEEIDNKVLNRYTKSLRKYVKQVYGW